MGWMRKRPGGVCVRVRVGVGMGGVRQVEDEWRFSAAGTGQAAKQEAQQGAEEAKEKGGEREARALVQG